MDLRILSFYMKGILSVKFKMTSSLFPGCHAEGIYNLDILKENNSKKSKLNYYFIIIIIIIIITYTVLRSMLKTRVDVAS